MIAADNTDAAAPTAGWTRPILPPEGEANFLEEHPFELVRTPLPDSVLVEQVLIPMREGIKLPGTVFRPANGDVVPVITTSTPYGKDDYEQWNNFRDAPEGNVPGGGFYLWHVEVSDHTPFEAPDPGYWIPNGYAILLVDHPGLGKSQSNPARQIGITLRWHDVMAWLEAQAWCTGKVGMSGVSALCAVRWMAAMNPAGGYGGIPETAFPAWIGHTWIGPNVNPDANGPEPTLFDWHYDTSLISVPALVCASFSDQELHTWDTFDAFGRIKSEQKWLFNHRRQKWGAYYGAEELALQKAFLDRFLKDDAGAMDGVPTIRLEINESRDTFKVITAEQWPLPKTTYESWYLDASSGALSVTAPTNESTVEIAPAPVDDTGNRAVFDYTFDADIDLIGHMVLKLNIEAVDTDQVDLFVGVEKLYSAGNEVYFYSASGGNANGPVTRGWLRA